MSDSNEEDRTLTDEQAAQFVTNGSRVEVPTFTVEQLAELQREAERTLDLQRKAAVRRAKLDRVTVVAGQIAGGLASVLDFHDYASNEHIQDDIARGSVATAVKILELIEALP